MRLIDADELMRKLQERDLALCVTEWDIKEAPTIDAAPVVRCKDCQSWDKEHISVEGLAKCITGESGIRYRRPHDFCSFGERVGQE